MLTRGYKEYINSPEWKTRRREKIGNVAQCERCGRFGDYKTLQVHHRHYNTLGRERDDDLEILCQEYHRIADRVRRFSSGFKTYCLKKYGEDWHERIDRDEALEEFHAWLEDRRE